MKIFNTRNLVGLLIITAGIILLLNNLGVIEYTIGDLISLWPIILLFFGLKHLYRRQSFVEIIIGIILTTLGGIFLAKNTGFLEVDLTMFWKIFWPVIIIFFGFTFISNRKATGSSNFAILGGIDNTKKPWELNSGSYIAFMGGVDLDMTLAEIKEEETVLDFTAIMGGIDVTLPDNVDVQCKGTGILGGVELLDQDTGGIFGSTSAIKKADETKVPSTTGKKPKKIIIQARTLMGGINIKTRQNKK